MPATEFLDTNILVYAYDPTNPRKQRTAQDLLRRALAGEIVASTQVLAEFAATLLHKLGALPKDVAEVLDALGPIRLVVPDADIGRRAVEAHATYGLHFYDGMMVAAADRAGCSRIWSEDLNSGQRYFSVEVTDPFR